MPKLDLEPLNRIGCKIQFVSIRRLTDLQSEIECRIEKQQFNEEFANNYMYRFTFAPPATFENAKSIIVVAMPRPANKATFNWRRKKHSFLLPPTYTAYDRKKQNVEDILTQAIGRLGYRVAPANLPLKLLAIRSGLAEYGKNNIAYVEGMGSFMRLTAMYTDMPPEEESWRSTKTLNRCSNCNQCQSACPTGAITEDHFMIKQEKCLTYHNEKVGSVPFPSWIKPQWHNCVIGCSQCQTACPENKPYIDKVGASEEFSEEETQLLLEGTTLDKMPSATLDKLQLLGLTDYYGEMPRNLSVLLNRDEALECHV